MKILFLRLETHDEYWDPDKFDFSIINDENFKRRKVIIVKEVKRIEKE